MSKQDRTYTRTAADLERKYNLGQIAHGGSGNTPNNSDQVSKVIQELSEYKTKVNSKLQSIETSITEIQGVLGSGVSVIDDTDQEVTQAELDLVSALANANKVAIEANASAIATYKASLEEVSGRVTTHEEWHNGYTEANSLDINELFE